MQETFESLTLNNSVLSINNHPTILSLKEIGSLEWDLVRSPIYTSKYELSIIFSAPDIFVYESERAIGTFDEIDTAFIDIIMALYNNYILK